MKHILLSLSVFFSLLTVAQLPYTFTSFNEAYTPLENSTSLNNGQIWDDPEYIVPIGFEWTYYDISTFQINFDGLGATLIVPNGQTTANVLIPYLSDVIDAGYENETSISNISHQTVGEPGNQIFKLEWDNCGFYNEYDAFGTSTNRISFQLWIYEGTNAIEFRFGPNSIKDGELVHDDIITGGMFFNASFNQNSWDAGYFLSGEAMNPSVGTVTPDFYDVTGLNMDPSNGQVYRFSNMQVSVDESSLDAEVDFKLFQSNNEEIQLIAPSDAISTVEIRGITGQLIERFTTSGNTIKNIEDYAPGIYLVHFSQKNQHKTLRFVKN